MACLYKTLRVSVLVKQTDVETYLDAALPDVQQEAPQLLDHRHQVAGEESEVDQKTVDVARVVDLPRANFMSQS